MIKCNKKHCEFYNLEDNNNCSIYYNIYKCMDNIKDKGEDNKMRKCNLSDCTYFDRSENNNCDTHYDIKECEWHLSENSIQLKTIINETFKNITEFNKKLNEEINEFKISINNLELCYHYKHLFEDKIPYDKENIIEEFYDVIQSMLQLMIFEGLTLEDIIQGQEKHFEKLEKRGWLL